MNLENININISLFYSIIFSIWDIKVLIYELNYRLASTLEARMPNTYLLNIFKIYITLYVIYRQDKLVKI